MAGYGAVVYGHWAIWDWGVMHRGRGFWLLGGS